MFMDILYEVGLAIGVSTCFFFTISFVFSYYFKTKLSYEKDLLLFSTSIKQADRKLKESTVGLKKESNSVN